MNEHGIRSPEEQAAWNTLREDRPTSPARAVVTEPAGWDRRTVNVAIVIVAGVLLFALMLYVIAKHSYTHASNATPAQVQDATDTQREQYGWDTCKAQGLTNALGHGDSSDVFWANGVIQGIFPDTASDVAGSDVNMEAMGCSAWMFGQPRP